uniref:ZOT protein n=1 Tax=Dulem virus 75 TaxID=3145786 RepID=A0AAU8B6V3_9VIRU
MQILILLLCGIFLYCRRIAKYTNNPYTLKLVVGSKGSGKSLLLAQIANQFIGRIYSNMGIGEDLPEKYWEYEYPQDSLILIDEIGVIHSNRDFKSMPREAIEWYKMQRKRRLTVVCSSQTMDVDKKIRDLCDRVIVVNRMGFLCVARSYKSVIKMEQKPEGGEDLVNSVKLSGIYKIYAIPAAVRKTEHLGYRTEQIISKTPKEGA